METAQTTREYEEVSIGYELCRKLEESREVNTPISVVTTDGRTYSDLRVIPHLSVIKKDEHQELKKIVIFTSSCLNGFQYFIWCAPGEKPEYRGPVDYYTFSSSIKLIPIKKIVTPP